MVTLLDDRTLALVLIKASEPGWEPVVERVTTLLKELGAESYLVEGPEVHAGRDGVWVGVYAVGPGVYQRWSQFVASRRESYDEALRKQAEVTGILDLLTRDELQAEIAACRSRILSTSGSGTSRLVERIENGFGVGEAHWVLDVPEAVERDVLWLWAAMSVRNNE